MSGGPKRVKTFSICLNCKKQFHPFNNSFSKYCCRKCYLSTLKGKPKSEIGRKNIALGNTTEKAMLGIVAMSKILRDPNNKINIERSKKLREANKNENHPQWKGDNASYTTIHQWLRRHYLKTNICSICNKSKKTDWANVSGNYNREDRNDWIELCRSCHRIHDYNFNIHKK